MKMFEIRRMELAINYYEDEKIKSDVKIIPISENAFDSIINNSCDWRDVAIMYLGYMDRDCEKTESGLKYYDFNINSVCCVYLISLTKKYI